MHIHWSEDKDKGNTRLWLDGALVLDKKLKTKGPQTVYFCQPGIHRSPHRPSVDTIYFDDFILADTLDEVLKNSQSGPKALLPSNCRLHVESNPVTLRLASSLSLRCLGQPTVQLQPLLYPVQVVIRAAALLSEAVLAGLEYVQFGRHPSFSPRAEQVDRPLVSDCLVVRRHRDEQRRGPPAADSNSRRRRRSDRKSAFRRRAHTPSREAPRLRPSNQSCRFDWGSTPNSAACCRTSRTACCPSAPAISRTFWPACGPVAAGPLPARQAAHQGPHRSCGISRQTRPHPSGSAVWRHPLLHTTSSASENRRPARQSSPSPPRWPSPPGNRAVPAERYSAPAACPPCRRSSPDSSSSPNREPHRDRAGFHEPAEPVEPSRRPPIQPEYSSLRRFTLSIRNLFLRK